MVLHGLGAIANKGGEPRRRADPKRCSSLGGSSSRGAGTTDGRLQERRGQGFKVPAMKRGQLFAAVRRAVDRCGNQIRAAGLNSGCALRLGLRR